MSLVVFNMLSWNRTNLVEVEIEVPGDWKAVKLLDPEGKVTPIQILQSKKEQDKACFRLIFEAENVPSMGYKTYKVIPGDETNYPNPIKAKEEKMENAFFKVRISPITGYVKSIFDKENNRELIDETSEGNLLQLIEDMGDSEGRLIPRIDRSNKFTGVVWNIDSKPCVEVLESGPVRGKVRISRSFQNSKYTHEIMVYSKTKRIDFRLVIDWHEIHRALKASFPLNIANPTVTFETQYGSITRPANGEEQPMQQWVNLSNSDGSYGVNLINDSKHACDVKGNTVRLTILRSPTEPAYNTDEGTHEVKYSIFPHAGNWKTSGVVRKGYEFNNPLIPAIEAPNAGKMPKTKSFLYVEPENLIVTVFKKAEDSEDFVLRLYETLGEETQTKILLNLYKTIKEAYKTNLLEDEKIDEVKIEKNMLKFKASPYEIATIKLGLEQE